MIPFSLVLPLRNQANLDAFLQQVTDPSSSQFHHYLTQQQVNDLYNPTSDQVQAVVQWLTSHGFQASSSYANNLIVDATGTAAQIDSAFHVSIDDYQATVGGQQRSSTRPVPRPRSTIRFRPTSPRSSA